METLRGLLFFAVPIVLIGAADGALFARAQRNLHLALASRPLLPVEELAGGAIVKNLPRETVMRVWWWVAHQLGVQPGKLRRDDTLRGLGEQAAALEPWRLLRGTIRKHVRDCLTDTTVVDFQIAYVEGWPFEPPDDLLLDDWPLEWLVHLIARVPERWWRDELPPEAP